MKNKIILLTALILLLAALSVSAEETKFTVEYRGQAYLDGVAVDDGTPITVWANDGKLLMGTAAAGYDKGYFNHLEIVWDDAATPEDEGVTFDDTTKEHITFKIGNSVVRSPEFVTVTTSDRGQTKTVNLYATGGEEKGAPQEKYPLGGFIIAGLFLVGVIIWYLSQRPK